MEMNLNIYKNIKKKIKEDGLLIQSWPFLVNRIIRKIKLENDIDILEIGSGKGCFTKKLIKNLKKETTLDIFEKKSEYNKYLKKFIKSKQIRIFNSCVSNLSLETNNKKYDYIVSSLPLKNFSTNPKLLQTILSEIKQALKPTGIYIQYQYSKANKKDIELIFKKEIDRIEFEILNIPPAYIYTIKNETSSHN